MSSSEGARFDMDQNPQGSPAGSLLTLRIIWGALLLGQVGYLFTVMLNGGAMPVPDGGLMTLLLYMLIGLLAVIIPAAYFIRGFIYRAGTKDGLIQPGAYFTGNLIFF